MATTTAPLASAEFELVNGELIEIPNASGSHNVLVVKLGRILGNWLDSNRAGVIISDTEFAIGASRLRPDLAILSLEKWQRTADSLPLPEPPEIAIEIISPSESAITLEEKIEAYLDAGVQEVWELYHSSGYLFIHTETGVKRLDRNSVIQSRLLPGWALPMSELLRKEGSHYF